VHQQDETPKGSHSRRAGSSPQTPSPTLGSQMEFPLPNSLMAGSWYAERTAQLKLSADLDLLFLGGILEFGISYEPTRRSTSS